jgi:transcriptional regulator with XRE-family HTH domain
MEDGVGRTLRETRTRRKIDLAEIEGATKIRARYLRAIENEEWDLLPGETYARAFIRAYAGHLGLDGERLAEEQRRDSGASRPGERLTRPEPVPAPPPRRPRREGSGISISPRLLAAIVSVALVALLIVVGLSSGGGGEGPSSNGKPQQQRQQAKGGSGGEARQEAEERQPVSGHTVSLIATAEVWVCLLDASGAPLINGQILAAGSSEGPYRSDSFTLSLGNGEVTMTVDGEHAPIPETASPVGYSIDSGALRELSEGERPTCT